MSNISKIENLKQIMRKLRDPDNGCPWDVEQDFASIAPYTIEEAYEVEEAIRRADMEALREELGDLLLQVVFHSQMASEEGLFDFEDVVDTISEKLVSRHPNVFAAEEVNSAREQEIAWEEHKRKEREAKALSKGKKVGILDGVALALPALVRAEKLQKRAAKVGFDWSSADQVFGKIYEELRELRQATRDNSNIEEEMGDLFFAISNLARKLKVDSEAALKKCNAKFERRFAYIEEALRRRGTTPQETDLEELDRLWDEAKLCEKEAAIGVS